MKRKLLFIITGLICIMLIACTKANGPNRKSDAKKRAIDYIMEKYNDEFETIEIVRLSNSGEKLTYQNTYIISDGSGNKSYNVVVHYDEKGRFVDIGDDRESDRIRQDFMEYATILGCEPESFSIGQGVDGGGENAIDRPIYYYNSKYNGDIVDYIKKYKGVIYISYRFAIKEQEEELENKLKEIQNDCLSTIEIRCSVTRKYSAGISTVFPADSISSYTLKDNMLKIECLTKKTHSFNTGIDISTYIEESGKNMIDIKIDEYKSQVSFLAKNNVLLRCDGTYKDSEGNLLEIAYQVGSGFDGLLEARFLKSQYDLDDVKVYDGNMNLISPSVSDIHFYENDDYFYYLVKENYIISLK